MNTTVSDRLPAAAGDKLSLRTRLSYSIGCIGRDANYGLVSSFIMTYLTLAVGITDWQLGIVGVIMVAARIWDAVNDPLMGMVVDGTRSRFGKFKPYIISGALLNSFFTVLLFTTRVNDEKLFVAVFAVTYILWGMTFTMNDISYWGMLPSLTVDPQERSRLTGLVRIFACLGVFLITALVPVLTAGRASTMYGTLAVACLFVACQILVVLGVQEPRLAIVRSAGRQSFRSMGQAIYKNDQLLVMCAVTFLVHLAYFITAGFGIQFFYFDYGVYGGPEFAVFALTLGVAQILTLALAPGLMKNLRRKTQFAIGTALMVLGYLSFMLVGTLLPMHMASLVCVGFVLFVGQAILQLLIYVSLADTVEYGQWKLGARNESVTFSLRPFVDKMAGAAQAGIFSLTMILSGLNAFSNRISVIENNPSLSASAKILAGNRIAAQVPDDAVFVLRLFMMGIPLILVLAGFVLFTAKYKIDENRYARILRELEEREKNCGGSGPPQQTVIAAAENRE